MKQINRRTVYGLCAAALLLLTGAAGPVTCSEQYQSTLASITANVQATNDAIAAVAPGVAKSCQTLAPLAQALADLAPTKHNVQAIADSSAAVLVTYCTSVPTDLATAAQTLTAQIKAARAAYADAKARNG